MLHTERSNEEVTMNSLILKLIALLTMIMDHYGAIFCNDVIVYRIIGRLAFPIYCFLLVEGYAHTSNVRKYALRLLIFAFISEIPFDLAFFNEIGFKDQNIFFTLFIGLAAIYLLDNKKYNDKLIIISALILATLLRTDYEYIGIVYILSFYKTRNIPAKKRMLTVAFIMFIINLSTGLLQQFSVFSLLLIYNYNNEQGIKNKWVQIGFYAAYPVHLFIFYIIKIMQVGW